MNQSHGNMTKISQNDGTNISLKNFKQPLSTKANKGGQAIKSLIKMASSREGIH